MQEEIGFGGLGELESTKTHTKKSGKTATLQYDIEKGKFYILVTDLVYYLDDEYVSTKGIKIIYRKAGLDYSDFHEPAEDWQRKKRSSIVTEDLANKIDFAWARYKPGMKVKYLINNTKVIIL